MTDQAPTPAQIADIELAVLRNSETMPDGYTHCGIAMSDNGAFLYVAGYGLPSMVWGRDPGETLSDPKKWVRLFPATAH